MSSKPSKAAEAILGILLPPACREEVLGDLHERFQSHVQYAGDAFSTVPHVILSRIRRTSDAQVVVIQAFAGYLSFLGAARIKDATLLEDQLGLLRLAIPVVLILLGLILDDAYSRPGPRLPVELTRGPLLGIVFALAAQGLLWISNPALTLPFWILLYGCAMSLLLTSAIRKLFPPAAGQLLGVNVPALWLKRTVSPMRLNPGTVVLKIVSALAGVTAIVFSASGHALSTPTAVSGILIVVVAYTLSKRNG